MIGATPLSKASSRGSIEDQWWTPALPMGGELQVRLLPIEQINGSCGRMPAPSKYHWRSLRGGYLWLIMTGSSILRKRRAGTGYSWGKHLQKNTGLQRRANKNLREEGKREIRDFKSSFENT